MEKHIPELIAEAQTSLHLISGSIVMIDSCMYRITAVLFVPTIYKIYGVLLNVDQLRVAIYE